jgi:menaquinol-cytochrome c reductase iron-sulfur subunit
MEVHMSDSSNDNSEGLDRRDFLGKATLAIGGLISLGIGIPAVAYVVGPALQETGEETWIQLGSVSKVELGTPTLFKTTIERQTGWIINQQEVSVYVLSDNGRDFVAMSNVCTHLGCRVRWIADQRQFFCPCHNAAFDADGNVVDGPPPRPLDRYEVKVENDQLYIRGS